MLRFEPHNWVVGERVRVIFRVSTWDFSRRGKNRKRASVKSQRRIGSSKHAPMLLLNAAVTLIAVAVQPKQVLATGSASEFANLQFYGDRPYWPLGATNLHPWNSCRQSITLSLQHKAKSF